MKLTYLAEELGYVPQCLPDPDGTATCGYTSDLLSDVMGNAPEDSILITVQAHKNAVAVASLAGMKAIVLCSRRTPSQDMLDTAEKEGIAIFTTADNQFSASWKIARGLSLV